MQNKPAEYAMAFRFEAFLVSRFSRTIGTAFLVRDWVGLPSVSGEIFFVRDLCVSANAETI